MEIAPDSVGAVLSWRIRLLDKSGRARRLRLTSFCEIAGIETGATPRSRFRRHACRDRVRARSRAYPRPQSAVAVGARRPRRDLVLRRQAGGRGDSSSATKTYVPVSSARVRSPIPRVVRRCAGASSTTRASFGHSIRRRASPWNWRSPPMARPRPNSLSAVATMPSGRANWSPAGSALPPCPSPICRCGSTRHGPSSRRPRCRRAGPSDSRSTARRCG